MPTTKARRTNPAAGAGNGSFVPSKSATAVFVLFVLLCCTTTIWPAAVAAEFPGGSDLPACWQEDHDNVHLPVLPLDPRTEFRRRMTRIVVTLAGAAIGGAVGGWPLAIAGGLAGWFVSPYIAEDLFPAEHRPRSYYMDSGTMRLRRSFQSDVPIYVDGDERAPRYRNGFYGGTSGNCSEVQRLYDEYIEAMRDYTEALRDGRTAELNELRARYVRARSAYLRARGVWVGP